MLRAFRSTDIKIDANKYTKDYLETRFAEFRICDKRTLDIDGVKAIICFFNYNLNNYRGAIILSNDFNSSHFQELKDSILILAHELDAKRIETESIDCKELNTWHEKLGFSLEGKKVKAYNNLDYSIWGMTWE